jgi:hypothetical protein
VVGAKRWLQMRGFYLYGNVVCDAAGFELVGGKLTLASAELANPRLQVFL